MPGDLRGLRAARAPGAPVVLSSLKKGSWEILRGGQFLDATSLVFMDHHAVAHLSPVVVDYDFQMGQHASLVLYEVLKGLEGSWRDSAGVQTIWI